MSRYLHMPHRNRAKPLTSSDVANTAPQTPASAGQPPANYQYKYRPECGRLTQTYLYTLAVSGQLLLAPVSNKKIKPNFKD
jgi:hypothetical protein